MMQRIRTIATGALLLVGLTAGSATAGALVTGAQIKDGTVAATDVRDSTLTGSDVRDRSLGTSDVGGLAPGPQGARGLPGFPGANGAAGLEPGAAPRTLDPGERLAWVSYCDPGEQAISGGVSSTRPDAISIERSTVDGAHWAVTVLNDSKSLVMVDGWALCLPV